jgi:hypothetical protein
LGAWLAAQPNVSEIQESPSAAESIFPGSDADLAALLRAAILAGASICSAEEKTDSLEELFARLSTGEVM